MSKCILDGHKPLEVMTAEELDEFFMKEFGLTFEDFKKKNSHPEKNENIRKED